MLLVKRCTIFSGVLLFGFSISALGDTIADPVGFCQVGGDCFTATGLNQGGAAETIGINGTSFQMEKNGNGSASASPWDLLIAVPNDVGGTAPTISFAGNPFTLSALFPKDVGTFTTGSGNLYAFAGLSNTNPSSMNATNMFGINEQTAFGGTPTSFEVFDYQFTPAFVGGFQPYVITVGGAGLPNGTFLATDGGSPDFSTPFTLAGLVNGPGCPDCGQGNPVPEPSQIAFLLGGGGLLGLMQWRKQRQQA
jgi:hypothetical protein